MDERFRDEPGRTLADLVRIDEARARREGGDSMTQVVYYVAASLDGFIAGPQGELNGCTRLSKSAMTTATANFLPDGGPGGPWAAPPEVARSFGAWPYGDRPAWLLTRRPVDPADLAPTLRVAAGPPEALHAQWQAQGLQRVWWWWW